MDFDTFLVPLLVISMSLGTAAVILAVIVITHRAERPDRPAETQDDFTTSIRKWGDLRGGADQ